MAVIRSLHQKSLMTDLGSTNHQPISAKQGHTKKPGSVGNREELDTGLNT